MTEQDLGIPTFSDNGQGAAGGGQAATEVGLLGGSTGLCGHQHHDRLDPAVRLCLPGTQDRSFERG